MPVAPALANNDRDLGAEEWARLCARDPTSLAVVEPSREVTVGELIAASRARAGEFLNHGVQPGDRVILARPNVDRKSVV